MTWIALTGVNGFIGHHLALELLAPDLQPLAFPAVKVDRVLGLDLLNSRDRRNHERLTTFGNYRFGDAGQTLEILNRAASEWGGPPVAVIHNGACSSTTETDPEVFRVQNVEASQAVFTYCAQHQIPFLYASSASVYGDGSLGFDDGLEANSRYTPMNLYGRSKHQFDSWVLEQVARPPVWFGLRYFNVFGAFEEHKQSQASVFHWGRRQILESGCLRLYQSHQPDLADGEQRRDFVPVQDVCRVTWGLLRQALQGLNLPKGGAFVNVGRGVATSWIEIGTALFEALGRTPEFEFIPMPEALREHYQNYTKADLRTLHSLGLEEPFLGLREAFQNSTAREVAVHARDLSSST